MFGQEDRVEELLLRATWACALECPELVGIQQAFSDENGQIEATVPIVADAGHEWLLATLLPPFDLASSSWDDLDNGLWIQVQQLLEAAQHHPVDDIPHMW